MSELERQLYAQIEQARLPLPELEYHFHPVRKWRFDFCWPERMLAVEAEGGTWTRGRHTRGKGFEQDCEKYNEAALLGWHVLRLTSGMIDSEQALKIIVRALDRFTRGVVWY